MFGEQILARTLSVRGVKDRSGNEWQYHSRSDRHSKVACWGVLFDTLRRCDLLRRHASAGKVIYGINHEMTDFVTGKLKKLDLVISQPRDSGDGPDGFSFADLRDHLGILLTATEQAALRELPELRSGAVGDVLVALESKACMTAHTKAQPRFFDELASSSQCINGSAPGAVAVGHAIINTSPAFVSADLNKRKLGRRPAVVSHDPQPMSADRAVATVRRLVLRGHPADRGYDALGVTMLELENDGSPVRLSSTPPALKSSDPLHYERMILRVAGLYDTRFQNR